MSMEFNDPEIFADFIIESKEHLETIEPNLLELEKAPQNLALINEIFRPMHSLKGASGFMGLNRINVLAHRAENVLDELRKGSMSVTSEIMDVILSATDALRQMIESLEKDGTEGDVDTAPIISVLDSIMAGELPVAPAAPATEPVSASEEVTSVMPEPEVPPVQVAQPDTQNASAPTTGGGGQKAANSADWIAGLPNMGAYDLSSFGAEHLKDFVEEAKEDVARISDDLLDLEKNPGITDSVNDVFRYFHNIKGNSGIIGYHEVNGLTHEAETLLNLVRQGKMPVTGPLVDILLLVVDVLEELFNCIDMSSGKVQPFDISELLEKLRQATAGGSIELPTSMMALPTPVLVTEESVSAPVTEQDDRLLLAANATKSGDKLDASDIATFRDTTAQQFVTITTALDAMRKDGNDTALADALYRSLVTIQNSASYMDLEDIKIYAERTAGIVDQGRKTKLDFSMMVDLLTQECEIIADMVQIAIANLEGKAAGSASSGNKEKTAEVSTPTVPAASVAQQSVKVEQTPTTPKANPKPEAEIKNQPAAAKPNEASASSQPAAPAGKPSAPGQPATPTGKPGAPGQPAAPAGKPGAPAPKGEESSKSASTIRVDHEKLDHLMNLIGELIINRNRYTMLARHLENNTNVDVAQVAQDLSETTYAMARISDDLQDTIMKVRMVPVASVFSRFPRLVRDISRKSGKEVELLLEGEDTELDKSVVEVIGDPLVHLIRNSVDHGIENADARKASGKDAKGHVWLRAYHKGNSVAIEIEDDGKGIDPEKMREVAVRKGIATLDEVKAMDDREAIELIFMPGFSGAEKVTDISGRGVGMDVVRTNIKSLKGSININTEVGKGTRFTLSLPLTLAIIDALMVNVADEMYAIPLDAVSETTKIEASRLTDVKGRKAVTLRGEVLGIISLAELLGLPCNMDKQEVLSVVIIHDNDRRLGIVVDRLLERQEIVIKPLGSYLGDLKGISGATIMGDGSVILIMDPHEIYMLATSKAI